MATPAEKAAQAAVTASVVAWLERQKILVADANKSSRSGIGKLMSEMGGRGSNITLVGGYADALEQIKALQPGFIVTDFDFGKGQGLNLRQEQRLANPEARETLFVVVTGNTSQSAVAQAAEEDVDSYILKPYTMDIFRQCVLKAVMAKISPSPYVQAIDAGKELLHAGKAEESIAKFKAAQALDPKPSLACFYIGQAELMKKVLEGAEGAFKQGLSYNNMHFKCMVGLFDSLMERKCHADAYEVIKKISTCFPANPKRLTTIIRLALINRKVEDMEAYHQIFMDLEVRSPEMINYISAGLIVSGRYYLKHGDAPRALELFKKAAVSSVNAGKFLREIVVSLAEEGLIAEAGTFLKRFTSAGRGESDFLVADFSLAFHEMPPADTVQRGRAMLKQGVSDPGVHELLIRAAVRAESAAQVEEFLGDAKKKWPDQAARFEAATVPDPKKAAPPATPDPSTPGQVA
jgi:CheY-like chemotaxis protein